MGKTIELKYILGYWNNGKCIRALLEIEMNKWSVPAVLLLLTQWAYEDGTHSSVLSGQHIWMVLGRVKCNWLG